MSVTKLAQVLKTPMNDPIAKFTLLVLADHYNDSTGQCYPSVDTIAEIVGCNRRTVLRKLKELEQAGYIQRQKRFNKTDLYEIAIGDNLTGDTVSPLGVTESHTNAYRTLNNKKKAKITLLSEWQPTEDCIQHCKDKGIDPDFIWEQITLWNEQHGNKAKYASLSAFYKGWVNREAKKIAARPAPSRQWVKPSDPSTVVAQKKNFSVDEWHNMTEFWQDWYRMNRPSAIPEGVN